MQPKLYFYEVDDDYIEYLSQFDTKIMYAKEKTENLKGLILLK